MKQRLLPPDFAELEAHSDWALASEAARLQKRLSSSMEEIQAFYCAMLEQLESALEYLNGFPLEQMPEPEQRLLYMTLSLAEIWVAVDRTIWEIGVNTAPPRNAGELFCQEYNKIGLRDTLMKDTVTHEKVQQVLKSGVKEHFHFQDEELVLRNFHQAFDCCLAAYHNEQRQP